jgi:peptidoglycan/xylan/chitin deacetylase (PgdA/CDA1 family)
VRAISLLYHDVVRPGDFGASGFGGGDADIYKLDLPEFELHLNAVHSAIERSRSFPVNLTFDDGGASAHEYVADRLERLGRRGYFFVTTDWIGKDGFLNPAQIRELHGRGHFIGSHSCSHPPRMSHCSRQQLEREWNNSVAILSDILGDRVELASVPGGYYGRNVAEAAADAGIRMLFTSEPQIQVGIVGGCTVLGRYTIQQGVKAATAAAIASGSLLPRYRQFAYWNAKKMVKRAGGNSWLRVRKWVLAK